jgi:sugar lactone lactonase YvrE
LLRKILATERKNIRMKMLSYGKSSLLLAVLAMVAWGSAWGQTTQQGPALLNSDFANATGIAVDAHGNLYVADAGAGQVDEIEAGTGGAAAGMVSASSTMVTVGSGFTKPTGVAVDAAGDVFVADAGAVKVFEIEAGTGGAAAGMVNSGSTVIPVGSGFKLPNAVAVDGHGDVFVADLGSDAVDEIEAGTGGAAAGMVNASSTVMAVGAGFSQPGSVAVDGNGNVYVGDTGSKKVFEIESGTGGAATGMVNAGSTVTAITSGFTTPQGVAVDAGGNVFFVTPVPGNVYEILAGTGGAAAGTVTASSTEVALGSWSAEPTAVTVNGAGVVYVVASDSVWDVQANSSSGTTPVGNFTLTVNQGTSTVSVNQGSSVTVPFSVTSTSGFTGMVAMSCTSPSGYTCTFSPTAVSLTSGATQTGSMTVTPSATTTVASNSASKTGPGSKTGVGALQLASFLWMPGLLLGGLAFRRKLFRAMSGSMRAMMGILGLGLVLLSGASALSGCNYPNINIPTKTTSFQVTVMVTATGGTVQQNFPLYLQVQLATPIVSNRGSNTNH